MTISILNDLRFLTGPSMLIIGGLLVIVALRLWLVHPINRVLRVAPFVTEAGLRALMAMRPLFFSTGMFLVTSGCNSVYFWFFSTRNISDAVVVFLGSLAASMGIFATIAALMAGVALWRGR